MSIIRTVHNKENPYVQINKKALWDENLSLQAVGLWARLLSRPDNWQISVKELCKSCKLGRDTIRKLLKELIQNGYAYRMQPRNKGKFNDWDTYVFEFKVTEQEIKEMFTETEIPAPVLSAPMNHTPTNTDLTNSSSLRSEEKQICKEGSASPPPSAEAEHLTDFFLSKIRERNPEFKEPNKQKWAKEFDLMLRIDKRDVEKIKWLINWAAQDNWWKANCLSPAKLRDKYDEMLMQSMSAKEKETVRDNRTFALKMKEKYPEQLKSLSFDDKYVSNRFIGKEVPFFLPTESFREAFFTLFGGQYVRR